MPLYIITYNYGSGEEIDVVEAKTEEDAKDMAYEAWREGAESSAEYEVVGEATEELREEYGV